MRIRVVLVAWILLVLVLSLLLYLLDTLTVLSFVGTFITTTVLILLVILRLVRVEAHEHLIICRAGRCRNPGGPGGWFFLIRTIEIPVLVDLRPQSQTLEGTKCFTQDGVEILVGSSLRWRVSNPLLMVENSPGLRDTPGALGQMVRQALTAAVGQRAFQDVIHGRQALARELGPRLQGLYQADIQRWGLAIDDVGLGEIDVPPGIAEAIARQVAVGLMAPARTAEGVGTAEALNQMQAALNDPSTVDRALLLQVMRLLSDAIAQRK